MRTRRGPAAGRRWRSTVWGLSAAVAVLAAGVGAGLALARLHTRPAATATVLPEEATRAAGARPAPALHGEATWAAGARPAPAVDTLREQTGRRFSLASVRGRPVAMTFFDSYCHQECPLEGRALAAAERALPPGERPVLVVVSVNPRDTPASARSAVVAWGLAGLAPWHWLRGTHAQLAPVWAAYHIAVAPPANGDISHTEALYLIDRQGAERSAYLYPFAPQLVSDDLERLARG